MYNEKASVMEYLVNKINEYDLRIHFILFLFFCLFCSIRDLISVKVTLLKSKRRGGSPVHTPSRPR